MRIALLAKGHTLSKFIPNKHDEVWGLNQLAKTHDLDRTFILDDLVQRLPAWDEELAEWLKTYKKSIITSRKYPDWPTSQEYPIRRVCKFFGLPLGLAFYSSVDYMLALAIYESMSEIDLYGVDCSHPRREERERVSIAMWIGIAMSRGIKVTTQPGSFFHWYTKIDMCYNHGMYGYVSPPKIEELI